MRKGWYSFSWGTVDMFVVDTEEDFSPESEQGKWLEAALAASKAPWKIVAQHVPGISVGSHGFNDKVNAHLRPVYERHGVAIVFAGHDHIYMRSKPIASQEAAMPITYVIAGGGGAPLYDMKKRDWAAVACSCYNYLIIQADPKTIHAVVRDSERNVLDTFSISKEDAGYARSRVPFEAVK